MKEGGSAGKITSDRERPEADPKTGRKKLTLLVLGVVAFAAYSSSGVRTHAESATFDSPRENIGWLVAGGLWGDAGASIPLRHHDTLPDDIARALTPRDAAATDGRVLPQDFAGSILLFAVLRWIWDPLALLLVPVLAAMSAFLVAQLVVELREPGARWHSPATASTGRAATIAAAAWLAYPGTILTGSMVFDSAMPTVICVLAASIAFIRFWRNGRTVHLVALTAFLGAAIALRYPSIFAAAPIVIALLLGRRLTKRSSLAAAAVLAPFAALVLGFNAVVYGAPMTTGYHLSTELLSASSDIGRGLFTFVPTAALRHLRFYAMEQPVILVPALAGLLLAWRIGRDRHDRQMLVTLIAASVTLMVMHAGLETWGSASPAINASFIRYSLPAVAIGFAGLAAWASGFVVRHRTSTAIVATFIVGVSVWTAVEGPVGLVVRHQEIETGRFVRAAAIDHTEPTALIATAVSDRAIFPHRQTLTLAYLATQEGVVRPDLPKSRWDQLPAPSRFADVADLVTRQTIPLYLIEDFDEPIEGYEAALRARGLRLEPVVDGGERYPTLYRIRARA